LYRHADHVHISKQSGESVEEEQEGYSRKDTMIMYTGDVPDLECLVVGRSDQQFAVARPRHVRDALHTHTHTHTHTQRSELTE